MIIAGMMSGTSADGIDTVIARILGVPPTLEWEILSHTQTGFAPAMREEIFACFRPETGTVDRVCALNAALGEAYAQAVLEAISAAGLRLSDVDLIGSHGQTIWHIPMGPQASTLQIGEAVIIAERTGIPVVSNFRPRDMAAGGQGAPLVAYVDQLLFTHPSHVRAAQNIGGIANVTFLPPSARADLSPLAFDTGPGNMLIDDAVTRATNGQQTFDAGGALAQWGSIHDGLLAELLAHPYLSQRPPKTTGREQFGRQYGESLWNRAKELGIPPEDLIATLTAFTAESIGAAYRQFLPAFPDEVIVSGGGARNTALMEMLRERLAPARVVASDNLGLPVEQKEALAFAVLAYETWHRRPGNLPSATGASHPVILGQVTYAHPTAWSSKTGALLTEARNPYTEEIDRLSTQEMVERINQEDLKVAEAVREVLPQIARAIDGISERMQSGGRLIYIGAGTSGRLGILDASECPPTFSTPPGQVVGLIAGGMQAVTSSIEGAEDDVAGGIRDIAALEVGPLDSVVGIAASGGTPYVLGGLEEARRRGALTISLACNHPSAVAQRAEIAIAPIVGPEVITGSTRLKAGTAQKMVLNMISTGTMVRLGKTFSNLMVDVQKTNLKLHARARRIVSQACEISEKEAQELLARCDGEVKTAIVTCRGETTPQDARRRLSAARQIIRKALENDGAG
jgi:anhydro-N-acetylmuramic acid kinase